MSKIELNSSLTTMDWLARLNVGKNGKMGAPGEPPSSRSGRPQPRKPPPSPIDLTARLDPLEAQAYRYHDAKPPYSYAALITFAINSSQRRRMTLSDIYNWISSNFPYYRDAGTGWKVGVRSLLGCAWSQSMHWWQGWLHSKDVAINCNKGVYEWEHNCPCPCMILLLEVCPP